MVESIHLSAAEVLELMLEGLGAGPMQMIN